MRQVPRALVKFNSFNITPEGGDYRVEFITGWY